MILIDLIKGTYRTIVFGIKHKSNLVNGYTLICTLWALLILSFAFEDLQTFDDFIAILIAYPIFTLPPLVPVYLLMKRSKSQVKTSRTITRESDDYRKVQDVSLAPPIESKTTKAKDSRIKSCPKCGGDLSELTYYKLKSGDDAKCEYCGTIISPGG